MLALKIPFRFSVSSLGNIGTTILGEYPFIADGEITPKLRSFKWVFYLLNGSLRSITLLRFLVPVFYVTSSFILADSLLLPSISSYLFLASAFEIKWGEIERSLLAYSS